MRPIQNLPVRFEYCLRFVSLYHLERPRLGIVRRDFAVVFAWTYKLIAILYEELVIVPAAVQPFLELGLVEFTAPIDVSIVGHKHLLESVALEL